MKKLTVSIDEQTHRQVRILAAEKGTSLSALVRVFINRLAAEPRKSEMPALTGETPEQQRLRLIQETIAEITATSGGSRIG